MGGLVVIVFQMAVDGLSLDQRDLTDASWGQWVMLQHLWPSQNVQEVAKWLV